MSDHRVTISWKRTSDEFAKGRYSREHTWEFDGGITVPASPSPSVVKPPWSNPAYVDPEEAFVAAVSSCHMLTFLFLASRKGFIVDSYDDHAVGSMTKNERGEPWISIVKLHPTITFSGEKHPSPRELDELHHASHEQCFIAQSIKTEVIVASAAE
jgi:organic hydroperoxide reductase OsmC/OhrA